jgi:D-arabinose 1-dehydrogenase-like Zn-dependent alcohol dehydrogenase
MRAVLYEAFQQLPGVVTVDDPACPETGVVIEVAATGLCRSDWHGWMGHDPDIGLPHVPGHEFAGVIAEVGSRVQGWHPGDRVTVPFVCACGQCDTCRRGEHQVCDRQFQPGFTHWGSFAEFVAIDHAQVNLVRIPDNMIFETAASLGCRFSTAYRAVVHHGRVQSGDWVVVHGCGGVGLSAVMIAAARGAHIIAVDISPTALELARTLGATATFDPGHVNVVNAVRDLTGGGALVSIDALGSIETCQNSIRSLRKRGRHVQVGLMLGADDTPPVPMATVIAAELEIVGSHGMAAGDYPGMLAEIAAGTLSPQRLVQHRIDLFEAPAKLAALDHQPGNGITIISPRRH